MTTRLRRCLVPRFWAPSTNRGLTPQALILVWLDLSLYRSLSRRLEAPRGDVGRGSTGFLLHHLQPLNAPCYAFHSDGTARGAKLPLHRFDRLPVSHEFKVQGGLPPARYRQAAGFAAGAGAGPDSPEQLLNFLRCRRIVTKPRWVPGWAGGRAGSVWATSFMLAQISSYPLAGEALTYSGART